MYFPLTGIFRYPVEAYTASWIEMDPATGKDHTVSVEAYTASWIEILPKTNRRKRRSVEAYTASWIEMYNVQPNG